MSERITFLAPLPPVALRRNRETASRGWRARLVREYQEEVWCAGRAALPISRCAVLHVEGRCPDELPWARARLTLTWFHHRAGPDADNALASCKWLIDVLKATGPRPLGIIQDDSPDCLDVAINVEKVRSKAEEGVLVSIERVDEHEFCHGDFHRCDGGGPGLADRYGDA